MVRRMTKDKEEKNESKKETPPFPDDEWFDTVELDEKLHIFDYTVDGVKKQVAFVFKAMSETAVRALSARCIKKDKDLLIDDIDQDKLNYELVVATCFYGKPLTQISREKLDRIRSNKKSGLYGQMVFAALTQSNAQTQSAVDEEKK